MLYFLAGLMSKVSWTRLCSHKRTATVKIVGYLFKMSPKFSLRTLWWILISPKNSVDELHGFTNQLKKQSTLHILLSFIWIQTHFVNVPKYLSRVFFKMILKQSRVKTFSQIQSQSKHLIKQVKPSWKLQIWRFRIERSTSSTCLLKQRRQSWVLWNVFIFQ